MVLETQTTVYCFVCHCTITDNQQLFFSVKLLELISVAKGEVTLQTTTCSNIIIVL